MWSHNWFDETFTNSNGQVIRTYDVGIQHVTEDLGFIPTAQEWISHMELHKWMGYRDKDIIRYAKEHAEPKSK